MDLFVLTAFCFLSLTAFLKGLIFIGIKITGEYPKATAPILYALDACIYFGLATWAATLLWFN